MATVNNNLSDYDIHSVPNASAMTFGIVVSEWNEKITKGLLKGAYNTLIKHGVKEENIITRFIPGAFELPLAAQTIYEQINVDAVICLGSVIQRSGGKHGNKGIEAAITAIKMVDFQTSFK